METLKVRKTQIYAAETYAVLAAVYEHIDDMTDADVIFSVDSEAACAALIRGASKEPDVGSIANAVQWLLYQTNCRPWFEWVDSASNCSDGHSRDGTADASTQRQRWDVREGYVPTWNAVTNLKELALKTIGYSEEEKTMENRISQVRNIT